MWETLPVELRPRLDVTTGMPAAGADVNIPSDWRIELDADTQPLGHLELDGLLVFARGKDIVLSMETLKMSVGAMQAGTASRPHSGKVGTLARLFSRARHCPGAGQRCFAGGSRAHAAVLPQ